MVVSDRSCTIGAARRIMKRLVVKARQMRDTPAIIHTSINVRKRRKIVRLNLTLAKNKRSKVFVDQDLCVHNQVKRMTTGKTKVGRRKMMKVAMRKIKLARRVIEVARRKTNVMREKIKVLKRKKIMEEKSTKTMKLEKATTSERSVIWLCG